MNMNNFNYSEMCYVCDSQFLSSKYMYIVVNITKSFEFKFVVSKNILKHNTAKFNIYST